MARQNGAAALADGLEDDTPDPTVRESLEAARDEVVGGLSDENAQDTSGARQRGAAGGDDRSGDGQAARERDQSGRFAPKARDGSPDQGAPAARAAPAPDLAAQDAAAGKVTAQPDGPPSADINLAPRLWSQTAKAEWSKLPEGIRREITVREQNMHRALTAQDQEREIGRGFRSAANPYNDVIQVAGVHPVRIFEDSLKVIRELQSPDPIKKATALGALARQYGIDPRLFAGVAPGGPAPAPGQPGAPATPAPQSFQLPPQLASMATEWQDFKTQQAEQQRQAQDAMATSVMTEIESFQSDPANKYFDQVKDHMRILLAGGAAQTLSEAYDQAIWARPDVRDQINAERAAAAKVVADKARQVSQAKLRGVSVRSRGGSAAPSTPGEKTLRETLQDNFAEARSRV